MAQTTSDWPRRMSPHEKTFALGRLVLHDVGLDVAARVEVDAEVLDHPLLHRAEEAHREQHEVGLERELGAGIAWNFASARAH